MSWLQAMFTGGTTPTSPVAPAMPGDLPDAAEPSVSLEVSSPDSVQPPPPTIKVAVLLDGDADFFTSAYLLKGYRGGRSAALDLRNKVNSLVHNRYRQVAGPLARPPEVYVVAQSFLNMVGLSHHLRCVDLRSFVQGFSSSGLAFSMIDVGSQKQAADDAIKAHLPFLLATCDVVLLGGSHDGGYAADLLRLDPEVLRTKVLLLRTTDFAAERILELGLDEVRFEGLFDGTDPSSGRKPAFLTRASAPAVPFFASSSTGPHIVKPPSASYSSTVALRPNGLVAASSSSHSSLAQQQQRSATSAAQPSATPTPYAPLVLVLRDFASRGQRRPSRADVEQALRAWYPAMGGYLKRYALEAALEGVIRLGKGETPGAGWVELVEEAAGQALAQGEQGKEGVKVDEGAAGKGAVASTSASPTPPLPALPSTTSSTSTLPTTTSTSIPTRFLPLVGVLEAQRKAGRARPLCAYVGEQLARSFPGLYAHFTTYCREAEMEGIVRMGVGEKIGSEYVELARDAPATTAPSAPPTSSTFSIPFAFLPLVSTLLSISSPAPRRTVVESKLASLIPRPYEAGEFKLYVSRAEKAKVVDTGSKDKEGEPCVKLTAAARAAATRESKQVEPVKNTSTPTSSSASSAFVAPHEFLPLVSVLRNIPSATAPWTQVGDKLGKVIPMPYVQGKFRAYVERAEAAGVIETGETGKQGQHWMRLTSSARTAAALSNKSAKARSTTSASTSSSNASASTSSFSIAPAFLPLVKVLLGSSMRLPTWSYVANEFVKIKPSPFDKGEKGSFKLYVSQAAQKGIVETGTLDGVEEHWIRLTAAARAAVSAPTSNGGKGR